MDIAAKVVQDDGGSLDVILYEHGQYSKPICIIPYFQFKKLTKTVDKEALSAQERTEKKQ